MSELRIIRDGLILFSIDYSYNTGEWNDYNYPIYKNEKYLMWAESYSTALGHCLLRYPESNNDDFEIEELEVSYLPIKSGDIL